MPNDLYTPEDSLSRHSSSFIDPPIDQPQACTCSLCSPDRLSLELESTLLYKDPHSFGSSYGSSDFGLWDVEGTMLPDSAQSLPSPHNGISSPAQDLPPSEAAPLSLDSHSFVVSSGFKRLDTQKQGLDTSVVLGQR